MQTYKEQIDAGLAYARASLSARLGAAKDASERERDAALALAIIALVAAQGSAEDVSESSEPAVQRKIESFDTREPLPVIINFERARASYLGAKSSAPRPRATTRYRSDSAAPRLALYRGE